MSGFDLEGRGRPAALGGGGADIRLESVDAKARLEEEEVSTGVFLGARVP